MTADLLTVTLAIVVITVSGVVLTGCYCLACCVLAAWTRWQQRNRPPGGPDDGEPLSAWEAERYNGCGWASKTAPSGVADLDMLCGACLDWDCARCDGEALVSGPCRCPHPAIAPRLGGGR